MHANGGSGLSHNCQEGSREGPTDITPRTLGMIQFWEGAVFGSSWGLLKPLLEFLRGCPELSRAVLGARARRRPERGPRELPRALPTMSFAEPLV